MNCVTRVPERETRSVTADLRYDKFEETTLELRNHICVTVLGSRVQLSSFSAMKQSPLLAFIQARFCACSPCSKLKLRR